MKRVEVTVPLRLLEDLGIVTARFFRHNESVEVLQSFILRSRVAALFVRIRRRGPFKGPETVRREARTLERRYRLERFEILSSDPRRGEYVAWMEWRIPAALGEAMADDLTGVAPLEIARAGRTKARLSLLASTAALPRLRVLLDRVGAPYTLRAVRSGPSTPWQPLAGLTARQRDLLALAYRLGYYESPATVSLDRIGDLVGVSRAALSKSLRAAERKMLTAVFGAVGRRG